MNIDTRHYDGADRIVIAGADGSLSSGFYAASGLANEQRRYMYDQAGRVSNIRALHMTASGLTNRHNTAYTNYDKAGNVVQY